MHTTTPNLFLTNICRYMLRKRDTSQWMILGKLDIQKYLEKILDLYLLFCLKFDSKDFNGSPKTENIWKIH